MTAEHNHIGLPVECKVPSPDGIGPGPRAFAVQKMPGRKLPAVPTWTSPEHQPGASGCANDSTSASCTSRSSPSAGSSTSSPDNHLCGDGRTSSAAPGVNEAAAVDEAARRAAGAERGTDGNVVLGAAAPFASPSTSAPTRTRAGQAAAASAGEEPATALAAQPVDAAARAAARSTHREQEMRTEPRVAP